METIIVYFFVGVLIFIAVLILSRLIIGITLFIYAGFNFKLHRCYDRYYTSIISAETFSIILIIVTGIAVIASYYVTKEYVCLKS